MTLFETLMPVVYVLAVIGYLTALAQMYGTTVLLSFGLAGYVFLQLQDVGDMPFYWAIAGGVLLAIIVVVGLGKVFRGRGSGENAKTRGKGPDIVIDGTNVLFWDGDPDLQTLCDVVAKLKGRDMAPFVFFDASSRHHLGRKSLDEVGFAKALGLPRDRVMVCPAGTEADAFILKFAREHTLPVVSNDRFGDRAQQLKGLKLIKGGIAAGKPILHGL